MLGVCLFTAKAADERGTATRQRTSFGLITDCEHRSGRGGGDRKYCHFNFYVGDRMYTGYDAVEQDVYFGQTKVVYFDPQDPSVSALEDFSEKSHSDRNMAYWLLAASVVITGIVLYFKVPGLMNSSEPTFRD